MFLVLVLREYQNTLIVEADDYDFGVSTHPSREILASQLRILGAQLFHKCISLDSGKKHPSREHVLIHF